MAEIYKLTGLAKMKGITAYIKDLIDAEVKFLIFAHHNVVMNAIEKVLIRQKVDYIRIDGSVNGQERFKLVERFQRNEECMVALLSINAASTGLTLTAASMVVFAELTWTPAIMIQAEDRVHRIGQEDNRVDVYYLYGKDTLDDYIFSKLDQKLIIVSTTLDDKKERMDLNDKLRKGNEHKKKALEVLTQVTDECSSNTSDNDSDEQSTNVNDLFSCSTEVDVFEKNNHVISVKRESDNDNNNKLNNNENINNNIYYKKDKRDIIN
jgi:SWI/SNF-related matrix-associated actin-dependent regulator 1 of chromatin subfamily A